MERSQIRMRQLHCAFSSLFPGARWCGNMVVALLDHRDKKRKEKKAKAFVVQSRLPRKGAELRIISNTIFNLFLFLLGPAVARPHHQLPDCWPTSLREQCFFRPDIGNMGGVGRSGASGISWLLMLGYVGVVSQQARRTFLVEKASFFC